MRPLADIINGACSNPERLLFGVHPRDKNARKVLGARLRSTLRSARRFYIEDDVTAAACHLGVQYPRLLYEMLSRARTPFQSIWLEWSLDTQIEAAGGVIADDAPLRTGVFVERLDEAEPIYRMMHIGAPGRSQPGNMIVVPPLAVMYHLRTPILDARSLPDYQTIIATSRVPQPLIDQSFIGGAYLAHEDAPPDELEQHLEYWRLLATHASYIFNPLTIGYTQQILSGRHNNESVIVTGSKVTYTHLEGLQQNLANQIQEDSGQWRFVLSLLALMNAQDFVERDKTFRAGRSHMMGGSVVPYLEHITVKLKLPRHVTEERFVRQLAEAIPRRRHEVMGHWRQSRKKGDRNCEHAYFDVTPTRQRCALCNHSRWWVNEFERGDASLGYVVKDRLVTR